MAEPVKQNSSDVELVGYWKRKLTAEEVCILSERPNSEEGLRIRAEAVKFVLEV